ncbi:MAG: hypothetical protein ACKOWI_06620, partial [Rhodoluna sp.]
MTGKSKALFSLALAAVIGLTSLTTTSSALADEPVPTLPATQLGEYVPLDMSFCVPILNYDSANAYSFVTLDSSQAYGTFWEYNGTDFACASDVWPGETAIIQLTTSRAGFADDVVTFTGRSLRDFVSPLEYSNYVQTSDGFTLSFTAKVNQDENWSLHIDRGQAQFIDDAHLRVWGLGPGETTNLYIFVQRPGY